MPNVQIVSIYVSSIRKMFSVLIKSYILSMIVQILKHTGAVSNSTKITLDICRTYHTLRICYDKLLVMPAPYISRKISLN